MISGSFGLAAVFTDVFLPSLAVLDTFLAVI
jgi:hypothetical protein